MQEETANEVSQISGQTRAEHQYAERTVRVGRVNSKPLKPGFPSNAVDFSLRALGTRFPATIPLRLCEGLTDQMIAGIGK